MNFDSFQFLESLEDTLWFFPGTNSNIRFLKGGRLLWNGFPIRGFWKMEGTILEINLNDFTLFRFSFPGGNMMPGTWERLKGDLVGRQFYSELRKVTD